MNGIHDLGGMDGFGPVDVERDEPIFHEPWERTVFGLATTVFFRRIGNGHAYRHAIERMDPVHYLSAPYYERMMTGIATMLVERGVISREQLDGRVPGGFPLARPGRDPQPPAARTSGFAVGDGVIVRTVETHGH